jgi:1-deoxy-D-xylulose-5-phosphate synthase
MMEQFPSRAFDVGIAEQHAVTFAAGLAKEGFIPFCAIYSTFLQRAFDQVIHDVALQKLPVVFCIDRGGLVGPDGATHHGAFDLAYLRMIPGITVASPLNETELRNLLYTAQLGKYGPFAIRYPRGSGSMIDWKSPFSEIIPGTGICLKDGRDLAFITIGPVGNRVLEVCRRLEEDRIDAALYDLRFVKPLDELMLHKILGNHQRIITVEDGTINGGMGSAVLEFASLHGYTPILLRLGIPDRFIEQGTIQELHVECGFDDESIYRASIKMVTGNP